ncbi:histidine kinase [Nocardioides sp. Root122]|uniref:response regulator n=1 Tax=Nocardioides TaxID=1839 RepID=UPI0007036C2D|nr:MULTISPECIES: response regulator [Nocardioides]KQV64346.1 histidine kinase [Nocardioides sp. Root122]MCK9825852.1 response regulator [Nocardioides cavernae]
MQALVIDDSRTMRMVLRRQLELLGYGILEAGDGQQALEVLAAHADAPPVLATVDWNMPVMNGLEFVKAVRAEAALRDVTLMMVTTESEHGQIVRALAAGAHEYLIKPFTSDALVDKLDYLGLNPQRSVA